MLENIINNETKNKIMKSKIIINPDEIKKRIPISKETSKFILESRKQIKNILDRNDSRFLIIVGPCSVHNYEETIEYAEKLKKLLDEVKDKMYIIMRVYIEKPRTNSADWKGFVYDPDLDNSNDMEKGLLLSRKLLNDIAEMKLPTATEILGFLPYKYIDDLISWGAIGARTDSIPHAEKVSDLSIPVGFKNRINGEIESTIGSIKRARNENILFDINDCGEYIMKKTKGNPYSHIILRGGNNGPNYDLESIRKTEEFLEKKGLPKNIIVDCSHGNSNKDHEKQILVFYDVLNQRINGNENILGAMIESNLMTGKQIFNYPKNSPGKRPKLEKGTFITDSGSGFNEIEEIIKEKYKEL